MVISLSGKELHYLLGLMKQDYKNVIENEDKLKRFNYLSEKLKKGVVGTLKTMLERKVDEMYEFTLPSPSETTEMEDEDGSIQEI